MIGEVVVEVVMGAALVVVVLRSWDDAEGLFAFVLWRDTGVASLLLLSLPRRLVLLRVLCR